MDYEMGVKYRKNYVRQRLITGIDFGSGLMIFDFRFKY